MKKLLLASLIIGLVGSTSVCLAATSKENKTPKANEQAQKLEQPAANGYAYLGVGIAPLPEAVASRLSDVLENGQGVLIEKVVKKSPASKAGLKSHDVITRYGDQNVTSPEQLVKLVRKDKPGDEVTLGIVREGKAQTVKVTLGEHQPGMMAKMGMRQHRTKQSVTPSERENAWKLFDSMTFKRLENNRFQAVINYRNDNGKIEHHQFEGTRNEIRKAIKGEKDLPAAEQQQLLQALSLSTNPGESLMQGFQRMARRGMMWDFQPTQQ